MLSDNNIIYTRLNGVFINLIAKLVIMLITKRTIYIAVLLIVCFSSEAYSQSFEERRQRILQEFQDRKQSVLDHYEEARENINRKFSDVLGKEWKESGAMSLTHNPLRDIPTVPPEQALINGLAPVLKTDAEVISMTMDSKEPQLLMRIEENNQGTQNRLQSTFYGSKVSVRFDKKDRIYLQSKDPSGIQTLWEKLSDISYTNLLYDFNEIRTRLDLCDWATLKLAQNISEMVYGNVDSNESVVLQSYLLSQCGLLTSFLSDKNGQLHLLIAADKQLDDYPEYNIDGFGMYQIDKKEIIASLIPHNSFDGLVPFRMALSRPGLLTDKPHKTDKGATVNYNDISFYSDYPVFYDEKDPLSMYCYVASVSLSAEAQNTLYPYLKSKMTGYDEVESVQLLLIYFHQIFGYEVDEKVWGADRRFFPEETLYYEFSDCEDNAILFSRIVRDLLGLKTVLVYMPGHMCAAVKFSEDIPGDAEVVKGERYLICDPTFFDSSVGQGMQRWKESKTTVIEL